MPYVFPALISRALGDDSLKDYDSAVRALISAQSINESERNVLIAHQNVTFNGKEAERGGSESMIGGVGQIDVSAFDAFDYVALGHIHASYSVGRDSVRYAGSPLCYHFDETRQKSKGPVLVDIGPKGEPVRTETLIIEPLHPMREIRGSYEEIRDAELSDKRTGEYISIILDDRRVTPEIAAFFRELYKDRNSILMEIKSAYNRFAGELPQMDSGSAKERSTEELFADFYSERNGGEPPEEKDYLLMDHAGELMRHASDLRTGPGKEVIDKFVDYLLRQEVE
jgi:exonuclease SbcD